MNFYDEWELTSDYEPASREYIGGLNTFASLEARGRLLIVSILPRVLRIPRTKIRANNNSVNYIGRQFTLHFPIMGYQSSLDVKFTPNVSWKSFPDPD